LQQRIPAAKVEVWVDMGHYPHLVRPDEFLAAVNTFAKA
jgi:pimeloyl-ACP methyl ester carboxylesterase